MNSIDMITIKLKESISNLQNFENNLEFNPDEQINSISDQLMNLLNSKSFESIESFEKIVDNTYERIIERSKNSNKVTGVSVNMSRLDHITSGFQNQDLVILAARPGAGKTALALNFFLEAAKSIRDFSKNEVVVFFSIEMSKEQLMQRLLSREAMVEQNRLRSGYGLSNLEKDQLKIAKEELKLLKDRLVIIDDPSLTLSGMLARLRQVQKSNKKIRMIILDYLQLLESDKSDKQNRISRQEEVANFSKKLKNIARTFNVPLISLAQLSRKVEERKAGEDKPMLSDLRESGAIEQDADIVMFLHHPKQINDSTPVDNNNGTPVVLVIAKHRNGSVGDVNMVFHKPTSTIKEDVVPSYDNL
jgi:replicative DNA helicase